MTPNPAAIAPRALSLGSSAWWAVLWMIMSLTGSLLIRGGEGGDRHRFDPELGHYIVARAEHRHRAAIEAEDLVDGVEANVAVRNDHHGPPVFLQLFEAVGECDIAIHVEVGAWLVEHDEARTAIERPRKCDPLTMSAGKVDSPFADLRLIAARQGKYDLVHTGGDCRLDDVVVLSRLEAGDIRRHGIGEQLDFLRQIANIAAEIRAVPLRDIGAVEPHHPARG